MDAGRTALGAGGRKAANDGGSATRTVGRAVGGWAVGGSEVVGVAGAFGGVAAACVGTDAAGATGGIVSGFAVGTAGIGATCAAGFGSGTGVVGGSGAGFSSALCTGGAVTAGFCNAGGSVFSGVGGGCTGSAGSFSRFSATISCRSGTATCGISGRVAGATSTVGIAGTSAALWTTGAADAAFSAWAAGGAPVEGTSAFVCGTPADASTCFFNSSRSRRRASLTCMLSSVSLRSCCRSLCCRQRRKTVTNGVATANSANTTSMSSTLGTLPYVRDP